MRKIIISVFAAFMVISVSARAQQTYLPPDGNSEWETVSPASLGWCDQQLDDLYDYLQSTQTRSFLLLKDGKIVIEEYFGDHNANRLYPWFSAGKSLRAVLIGIAQQEGALSIDEVSSNYLGEGWTSLSAEKEVLITIRNQLSMTTGLNESFFDCITPECLTYTADAGDRWAYHNGPYNLLKDVLEAATDLSINTYTSEKIKSKTGMTSGAWVANGNNTYYVSNARDMARFGLLIQNKGVWKENRVFENDQYFEDMLSPSQALNPSYGYLWWLNGKDSHIRPNSPSSVAGPLAPDAPEDLITAAGAMGQLISLSPGSGLLMIRQGEAETISLAAIPIINEIWKRLQSSQNEPCTITGTKTDLTGNPCLIYPVPTEKFLQVDCGDFTGKIKRVRIHNVAGNLLFEGKTSGPIDVSQWKGGLYYLSIYTEEKVLKRKFIID